LVITPVTCWSYNIGFTQADPIAIITPLRPNLVTTALTTVFEIYSITIVPFCTTFTSLSGRVVDTSETFSSYHVTAHWIIDVDVAAAVTRCTAATNVTGVAIVAKVTCITARSSVAWQTKTSEDKPIIQHFTGFCKIVGFNR